ncbi:MAG: low molecular weight phosphotyrosine protein phosphatase [Lachnospiraceae bacterium]|nr:low molecular weight phosphotyrosine protein phosphatase [Lachnospiraceae bacterium]
MKEKIKILFICHGNICRSPMAQYVMQDLVNKAGLSKHFIIDSAATSTEEIGNGVHYGTRQKLREVGVPCGDHRAVQITKKDYNIYDYLIVMDSNNLRTLKRIIPNDPDAKVSMLLDYANRQGQSIADPWYTGNFDATYRDVLEGCQGLLEYLRDRGMV